MIVVACGTSVYFYNIGADLKLSKNGFIQNLEANVLSVDISGDSRYDFVQSLYAGFRENPQMNQNKKVKKHVSARARTGDLSRVRRT